MNIKIKKSVSFLLLLIILLTNLTPVFAVNFENRTKGHIRKRP